MSHLHPYDGLEGCMDITSIKSYFTDQKTEAQRATVLPKATELGLEAGLTLPNTFHCPLHTTYGMSPMPVTINLCILNTSCHTKSKSRLLCFFLAHNAIHVV
jgi:hypothetical protein